MKKRSKRTWRVIRVFIALIVIVLIALVAIPFIFKDDIMSRVKREINTQVEARVDFRDFHIGLIRHFPNLSLRLDEVSVVGINDFEGDTLARIRSFYAVIDLISVFKGEVYEIKRIAVDKPGVFLQVRQDEQMNWDIVRSESGADLAQETPETETEPFRVKLKSFEITGGRLDYVDEATGTSVRVHNLHHRLSGDLSADRSTLKTTTTAGSLTVYHNGIRYLNETRLDVDARFEADLKNSIYRFDKNTVRLNALILEFDGSVAMAEDDVNFLLSFNAPKNSFRNILSMVPAIYSKDFEDVETEGTLVLDGYVKGIYNESTLPAFGLNILIDEASFSYPGLPSSVHDIKLSASVENSGGSIDNTIVDISGFHLEMVNNPVDIRMLIKNPVSDPFIDGNVRGFLDLSQVEKVYPLDAHERLTGIIDANITLQGRLSTLEKEDYSNFTSMGSILVKNLEYSDAGYAHPFRIRHAQLNFSPSYLDLIDFEFRYFESDLRLRGNVENYLPFIFGEGPLEGSLHANSAYFNVNDFMTEAGTAPASGPQPEDTVELTAFRVPDNIDVTFEAGFGELLYDSIRMKDVQGKIMVREEKIILSDLQGDVLEGRISVNGSYSTRQPGKPGVEFQIALDNLHIGKAYHLFGLLRKFAPIAEHASGTFSSNIDFQTRLEHDMMPEWSAMSGKGSLKTSRISLENVNVLERLSDALKTDRFRKLDLNAVDLSYEIDEGKLKVKPFDIRQGELKATVSGTTSLDQSIDYTMDMAFPREMMGRETNQMIDDMVAGLNAGGTSFSVGNTVNMDVSVGGTLSDPKVTTGLAGAGKNMAGELKENVKEEIRQKKEELEGQARDKAQKILQDAGRKAQQILAEAQKKADGIKKAAREAAQKTRQEAENNADKLIEEAKKKGPLAEIAAKKTAGELKKEADKKADQVISEADEQAAAIMEKARKQSEQVKKDARETVKKL